METPTDRRSDDVHQDDTTSRPNGATDGPPSLNGASADAFGRFQRAAALFEEVRHLNADDRERALADRCGDDRELLVEVRSLLAFHDRPSETLDTAILRTGIGAVIGRYRITDVLGEGGMGTVYRAEQEEPVRREVALKVIKLGMDTRQVVRRFEAERQAIAQMEHPNVARVLDAGSTSDGRPYFVMELVRGLPITQFCDAERMPLRARMRLFLDVCAAVQHAHQKGVIHRDLKPSNILVAELDGRPTPKVIDFGIAKALSRGSTQRTVTTTLGHEVGTPDYMSPEQAGGQDVDVRSDVYALGVILHELLVGVTPLRARVQAGLRAGLRAGARDATVPPLDELRRRVRDEDPLRPISALALGDRERIARARQTDPRGHLRHVRGDLEAITLKALALRPGRRYATVAALAEDVDRHLRDEPVSARVPSAAYSLAKLARRHTASLVASLLVLVAILIGLVLALIGFESARRDRDVAQEAQRKATDLADEVRNELFQRDIDRGRQRVSEGNLNEARDLLWTALLARPESEQAAWALRELMWTHGPFVGFWLGVRAPTIVSLPHGDAAIVGLEEGPPTLVVAEDGSVRSFEGPSVEAISIALTPDSAWAVVGDAEGTVTLWDVAARRYVRAVLYGGRGRTMVACPDNRHVVSIGADGFLRRTALFAPAGDAAGEHAPSEVLADLGRGATHSLDIGPSGTIAVGMGDGRLLVLDPTRGPEPLLVHQFPRGVVGIDFTPDNSLLGATSASRDYMLFDTSTWTPRLTGRISPGTMQDLRFTADGTRALLPGWWDTLEVDIASGLVRSRTPLLGLEIDRAPDGSSVAFAGAGRAMAFILLEGPGRPYRTTELPSDAVPHAFNAEDGTRLGAIVCATPIGIAAYGFDGSQRWVSPTGRLRHATMSRDGQRVAAILQNGAVRVLDARTGEVLARSSGAHLGEYGTIRFDERGEHVAYVARGQSVAVIDLRDGSICTALPASSSEILSIDFLPGTESLLACNRLGEYRLVDLTNGSSRAVEGPVAAFTAAAAADGGSVALGLWSGDFLLWEPTTESQRIARGHSAFPSRVLANPVDPDLFLSCADDGTVRIWHRNDKQDLVALTPYGPRQPIRHVDWSRDGRSFHIVGPDLSIRTYDIDAIDRVIDANREHERRRLSTPLRR